MKTLLCTLLVALAMMAAVACVTTAGQPAPWGDIDPDETYHLGEGSRMSVSHDGVETVAVRVDGGHLWLNGDDLGAYDKSQGVRFLRDGRMTVDGVERARAGGR